MIPIEFRISWREDADAAAGSQIELDPEAHPVFLAEVAIGQRFPELFWRCANIRYVNEFDVFHCVILSCLVRAPFSGRSTFEGDGVRICLSSVRRSRAEVSN